MAFPARSVTPIPMTEPKARNTRRSKYRPRTQAQKDRRQGLRDTRSDEHHLRARATEQAALTRRLDELEGAMRDLGAGGIHTERNTIPLDQIEDDERRFHVLKARVERLEALWSINQRKRETRGKIIIGGALLAEAGEAKTHGDGAVLAMLTDILDRRVDSMRDRLTVRELLGDVVLSLRRGGLANEGIEEALHATGETLPDFDAMAESALADEPGEAVSDDEIAADLNKLT